MEEIFLSEAYDTFLTQMLQGITKTANEHYAKMYNSDNGSLAYTDGRTTFINYASEPAAPLTQVERHTYYCGLNLHEGGHLLFTDFELEKKTVAAMLDKKLYPSPPINDYLEELEKYLETGENTQLLANLFHELDNCIEDGFVDRAIEKTVPGYASCLRFVNKVDHTFAHETYSEMMAKKQPRIQIFMNLVLSYAVFGEILCEETEKDELLDSFRELIPVIREAVFEPSPFRRKKKVMLVFCHLFHFFESQSNQNNQSSGQSGDAQNQNGQQSSGQSGNAQNQNGQQSSGQSGNSQNQSGQQSSEQAGDNQSQNEQQSSGGNNSSSTGDNQQQSGQSQNNNGEQAGQSLQEILKEALESIPKQKEVERKNVNTPDEKAIKELMEALKNAPESVSSSTPSKEASATGTDELNKIAERVAISQIQEEQEQAITNQMQNDVMMYLDGAIDHRGIKCKTERLQPTAAGKALYEAEHPQLDLIVKRFMKEFLKEIKDRQLGDVQTGLYAGKRFNAREAYRYDRRVMSNKIAPEDIPDMAVGILIDTSGSMSGRKLTYAIKCAYITYCFCQKLNIPCFVVGHTTDDRYVKLTNIVDESSLDGKDAKRIFEVKSGECNRDGYALRYCLGRLGHIVADQKIMLIISDGCPNHDGYGFQSGKKDLQDAVKMGVKQGISTIAAAIDDAMKIKALYQDGVAAKYAAEYLDLSDLEKLPKAFVKILKKRLE